MGTLKPIHIAAALALSLSAAPASAASFRDPFGAADSLPAPLSANCADTENLRQMDLMRAIDVALCQNPDTRASWAQAKAAAATLGDAQSAYLPTVTLDAVGQRNYTHYNSGGTIGGARRSGGVQATYGPELSLNWLLYDFGGREANVEAARQAMLSAGWTANSAMQVLVFQVIQGYAQVFSTQESLEAAKLAEKASKEAFEAARAREEVGVVTRADTAQAETAYSQSVLTRQKAENDLNLASGNFARLLHVPPVTELTLLPVDLSPQQNPYGEDVAILIKRAQDTRPDLAAARARSAQAEAELDRAKALNYPALSLNAGASQQDYTNNRYSSYYDNSVTLRLSVPLFTGFSNTYRIDSARHALDAAKENAAKTQDDVMYDVWSAYHNFKTATGTYETAQSLLASAQASEELTLGRYKEGKGTLIDALQAQANLADARRQWVSARYSVLVSRFDLARALGDTSVLRP